MQVRIMLPFSLQCGTCGEYIYRGTKFNASKEAAGEYLGIPVWRFYFRCSNCSAEMAMKTDPKNADYVCELGARRNFEPWKEAARAEGERADAREDEERGDAMRALENRTMDNKREMDVLNALEEDLAVNAQHAGVSTQAALAAVRAGGGAGRAIGSALATGAGAEVEAGEARGAGGGGEADPEAEEEEALRQFRRQREGRLVGVTQDLDALVDGDGRARGTGAPRAVQAGGGPGVGHGMRELSGPAPGAHSLAKHGATPRILFKRKTCLPAGEPAATEGTKKTRVAGPDSRSDSGSDGGGGLLGLGGYSSDE